MKKIILYRGHLPYNAVFGGYSSNEKICAYLKNLAIRISFFDLACSSRYQIKLNVHPLQRTLVLKKLGL
jgi:hypothetical protein